MKKLSVILLFVVLVSVSVPAMTQEKISADEALRWLPDGAYGKINFINFAKLKEAPAYKYFKMLFEDEWKVDHLPPLPEFIYDETEYIVTVQILYFVGDENEKINAILESKENKEDMAQLEELKESIKDGESKEELMHMVQEQLSHNRGAEKAWVIHCPNMDPLIKKALKEGRLQRTGNGIMKRPIYTTSSTVRNENKTGYFAYATELGDILISTEAEIIRRMVDAGYGNTLAVADNQDYAEAIAMIPSLGDNWEIVPTRIIDQFNLNVASQNPEFSDVDKGNRQEKIEHGKQFEIQSSTVTEVIEMAEISIFGTEETAKADYAEKTGGFEQAKNELKSARSTVTTEIEESGKELSPAEKRMVNTALGFAGRLMDKIDTTIDGTVVTTRIVFAERQLKTLGMLMNFAKVMEKKYEEKDDSDDVDDNDGVTVIKRKER